MQNLDRYLQAVGTQAALIAGFSVTVMLCDSLIGFTNNQQHWTIQVTYYGSAMTCLCLEFYCVVNSTLVSVLGPTYALNGPRGSMPQSVRAMKEERLTILYAFGAGAVAFGIAQIHVSWIMMRAPAAAICTCLVLGTFAIVAQSTSRISKRFKFKEEIAADVESDRGFKVSANQYLNVMNVQEASRKIDKIGIEGVVGLS